MDSSCLVTNGQAAAGGVMVWGTYLGSLVRNISCVIAAACLSIVADHIHPFITTLYPSSGVESIMLAF